MLKSTHSDYDFTAHPPFPFPNTSNSDNDNDNTGVLFETISITDFRMNNAKKQQQQQQQQQNTNAHLDRDHQLQIPNNRMATPTSNIDQSYPIIQTPIQQDPLSFSDALMDLEESKADPMSVSVSTSGTTPAISTVSMDYVKPQMNPKPSLAQSQSSSRRSKPNRYQAPLLPTTLDGDIDDDDVILVSSSESPPLKRPNNLPLYPPTTTAAKTSYIAMEISTPPRRANPQQVSSSFVPHTTTASILSTGSHKMLQQTIAQSSPGGVVPMEISTPPSKGSVSMGMSKSSNVSIASSSTLSKSTTNSTSTSIPTASTAINTSTKRSVIEVIDLTGTASPEPTNDIKRRKKDIIETTTIKKTTIKTMGGQQPKMTISDTIIEKIIDGSLTPVGYYDDKDGHYIINLNTNFTDRYRLLKLLGQGTFGKVVQAYDRTTNSYVAIKIIRSIEKYRDASKIEVRVLNAIRKADPLNSMRCIHLTRCFDYRKHICMVFDLLSQSVFDFLKGNGFRPFPMTHIQLFAKQLLQAVKFLHSLKLIHTDLKPENIMLVSSMATHVAANNLATPFKKRASSSSSSASSSQTPPPYKVLENTEMRLIDFGSAIFTTDYHSSVVSTRHYRAPEIILGIGWSFPCDMWSIGCILIEFFTGQALFQTHDNLEHLALMEKILGNFPPELLARTSPQGACKDFFNFDTLKTFLRRHGFPHNRSNGTRPRNQSSSSTSTCSNTLDSSSESSSSRSGSPIPDTQTQTQTHTKSPPPIPNTETFLLFPSKTTPKESKRFVEKTKPLRDQLFSKPVYYTTPHPDGTVSLRTESSVKDQYVLGLFYDFVKRMLVFDPEERVTAERALEHPFLKEVL